MDNLRRLLEIAKLESKDYAIWQAGPETPALLEQLPIKVGPRSWSGVLIDDEVQIRLGDFSTPSTAFLRSVSDQNGVQDGRIALIGPDLSLIAEPVIPFAMGVLVALQEATSELIKHLNRTLQVTDEIEGFMQRSARGDPRFLISKHIIRRGASFQHIGRAFLHLFRTKYPREVQKIEIFFLTAIPSVVTEMKQFREQAIWEIASVWHAKIQQVSKLRADCDFEWECETCEYQRVCEELRDIIRLREREKSASTR